MLGGTDRSSYEMDLEKVVRNGLWWAVKRLSSQEVEGRGVLRMEYGKRQLKLKAI